VEYKTLGKTGIRVSKLSFGASPLGNEFGAIDVSEGERAVHAAVDAGINLFDVSPYYGRTLAEERLGSAIQGRRNRVVLATKCGRYDKNLFDFSKRRVKSSVDESLRRLRTDYIDLFTAHDIEFGDREQILNETVPAMRELQSEGKVRYLGVSGLPLKMLADVAQRADVDYVLSYCHYNLLIRDLDRWLTPVTQEMQIGLINASPLHMGILAPAGPPPWHPAPPEVKNAGAQIVLHCQKRGVDPAAVALRFCVDHPQVSSTLVGMSSVSEVMQNLRAMKFDPPAHLMAEIETIGAPVLNRTWPSGRPDNSDA
jgi:L-galactose dehydrogenase